MTADGFDLTNYLLTQSLTKSLVLGSEDAVQDYDDETDHVTITSLHWAVLEE